MIHYISLRLQVIVYQLTWFVSFVLSGVVIIVFACRDLRQSNIHQYVFVNLTHILHYVCISGLYIVFNHSVFGIEHTACSSLVYGIYKSDSYSVLFESVCLCSVDVAGDLLCQYAITNCLNQF